MQRITIEKLGPVNHFTSEISQYIFLIGEQAVGKSTIAKSIYFCRNYKSVLREALYDIYNTGTYKGVSIKQAKQFIDSLKIFSILANVADVKSLVIHPATTTHSQLSAEELASQNIHPGTVRLSIGTEHIDDIIEDLSQAFDKVEY